MKDEYTFDFLELGDEYSERQLEQAMVAKIVPFLQEMGGMFAFVGNQYRLQVDDKEYFIDILLYHRHLRCLLAIELKIGEFIPEHVGKMQFYLTLLDRQMKLAEENPSIGIILCKSKNKTIVEYALQESNKPIGVASYRMVSQLPMELKGQLPEPEQVARLLEGVYGDAAKAQTEKDSPSPALSTAKHQVRTPNARQLKAIKHLRKKQTITNQEYQKICQVQKSQATKDLKWLEEQGIVKKIGTRGRGTHYVLGQQ